METIQFRFLNSYKNERTAAHCPSYFVMILKFACYYDAYFFAAKQQLTGTQSPELSISLS